MKNRFYIFVNPNFFGEHYRPGLFIGIYDNKINNFYQCVYPDGGCSYFASCDLKEAEELAKGYGNNPNVMRHLITLSFMKDEINFDKLIEAIKYMKSSLDFRENHSLFDTLEVLKSLSEWISNNDFDVFIDKGKKVDCFISDFISDEEVYLVVRENGNVRIENGKNFKIDFKN